MKPGRLSVVHVVIALALLATVNRADADTKPNPYEAIAERNPFGLRPPPPPPDPNEVNKPPPAVVATVEVTGITSILSSKLALLEIVPGPGKPALKPMLREGERVESIEVVSIDVEKGEVVINNAGVITNVSLKTPAKSTGAPAPAQAMAGLGQPPGAIPGFVPPGGNAYAGGVPQANPQGRGSVMVVGGGNTSGASAPAVPVNSFGANPNLGGGGYAPTAQGNYNPGVNTGVGDLRTIPSRTLRAQSAPQEGAPIDPAVQYINMAVQKQQAEAKGKPFPPLPPIPGLDQQ